MAALFITSKWLRSCAPNEAATPGSPPREVPANKEQLLVVECMSIIVVLAAMAAGLTGDNLFLQLQCDAASCLQQQIRNLGIDQRRPSGSKQASDTELH